MSPHQGVDERDAQLMQFSVELARGALSRGEIPIASIVADSQAILGVGLNQRVATGKLIVHAETTAIENTGRGSLARMRQATIYSTLSPCVMCTGAILIYRIPRVVVGDRKTFEGPTHILREAGHEVIFLDDEDAFETLRQFRVEHPDIWDEDNGGR